jgi:predicted nucleic acid-binding protein
VVDASVATRFILTEEYNQQARKLLSHFIAGEIDLVAPPLINYEVGNAVRTAASKRLIDGGEAAKLYDTFLKLNLGRLAPSNKLYYDTLEWSIENPASFYDAAYILSCKASGYPLITADEKQLDAAKGTVETVHLKDLQ